MINRENNDSSQGCSYRLVTKMLSPSLSTSCLQPVFMLSLCIFPWDMFSMDLRMRGLGNIDAEHSVIKLGSKQMIVIDSS